VQLGAFSAAERAQALLARAQQALAAAPGQPEADLQPRIEVDRGLHRVLVGALPDRAAAVALAAQVAALLGSDALPYVVAR
jgi:cell division septation protein DedD